MTYTKGKLDALLNEQRRLDTLVTELTDQLNRLCAEQRTVLRDIQAACAHDEQVDMTESYNTWSEGAEHMAYQFHCRVCHLQLAEATVYDGYGQPLESEQLEQIHAWYSDNRLFRGSTRVPRLPGGGLW